jgi:hypothetical protein
MEARGETRVVVRLDLPRRDDPQRGQKSAQLAGDELGAESVEVLARIAPALFRAASRKPRMSVSCPRSIRDYRPLTEVNRFHDFSAAQRIADELRPDLGSNSPNRHRA